MNKRGAKFFIRLKHPLHLNMLCFFSDERNFYLDQNNRWFVLSRLDAAILMKSKHPIHIVMFVVISYDGDVIPLFVLSHGPRLNTAAYTKCLKEVVLISIEKVAAGRPYTYATAHKQKKLVLAVKNFCVHITLTSDRRTPKIAVPLIIM